MWKKWVECWNHSEFSVDKNLFVKTSRCNQQTGRKLQDQSKRAKHKVCHLKRTHGLGWWKVMPEHWLFLIQKRILPFNFVCREMIGWNFPLLKQQTVWTLRGTVGSASIRSKNMDCWHAILLPLSLKEQSYSSSLFLLVPQIYIYIYISFRSGFTRHF